VRDLFARRRSMLAALLLALLLAVLLSGCTAQTGTDAGTRLSVGVEGNAGPQQVATGLQILIMLTVLTMAPALLIMVTAFTRIVIVLSLLRSALGVNQLPPNQVLLGLALFLTFFVMSPTWTAINDQALQPYLAGTIDQQTAIDRGVGPLREFMFKQTREKDLALFVDLSKQPRPRTQADVETYVLIPAFLISELKTAFQMGFVIFLPFLVIDIVVSSTLMSMGMMMLPPVMISLPFKILLFVMVDGWHLITRSLVMSFG
jgi:flagellar biosynthesis protein FliP